MSAIAADNHFRWMVTLGSQPDGYGCVIHPRIVLTSTNAFKTPGLGEGIQGLLSPCNFSNDASKFYCFRVGRFEKERKLAGLVLDEEFQDSDGKMPGSYPEIADAPPVPGQMLCVLTKQSLIGGHGANWDVAPEERGNYVCYSGGTVSLLRSPDKLLYTISGILTDDDSVGGAVFDQSGKIFGVVSGFLKHDCDPTRRDATRGAGRFIVFSPVFNTRTELLKLANGNERSG
jgi:hypothetical protein